MLRMDTYNVLQKTTRQNRICQPNTVASFLYTISAVVKIMRKQEPKLLYEALSRTCFQERRKPNRIKFYGAWTTRIWSNAVNNRLTEIFDKIDFDHMSINDIQLRMRLKKCFIAMWFKNLFIVLENLTNLMQITRKTKPEPKPMAVNSSSLIIIGEMIFPLGRGPSPLLMKTQFSIFSWTPLISKVP